MPDDFDAFRINPSVVLQPMEGNAILMNKATGDCFELNRVGVEVWRRLGKGDLPEGIVSALANLYGIPVETVSSDIRDLLAQLSRHGLLESRRRR